MLKPAEVKKDWYVVDASGKTLGRLATQCAAILRGKHKPTYTPNVDCGDYVIITNAAKVVYSGDQENKKVYYHHSMYPGGLKARTIGTMKRDYPVELQVGLRHNRVGHTIVDDVVGVHGGVAHRAQHVSQTSSTSAIQIVHRLLLSLN